VFGAGLNPFTTLRRTFFADACVIRCDVDPAAFDQQVEPQVRLLADARAAAVALGRAIGDRRRSGTEPGPAPVGPPAAWTKDASSGLDPRQVCREVDRHVPADRTTVVDAGHFTAFPIMNTSLARGSGLVWPIDFGAVGNSVGAAIGAAVGRPERVTVLFIGDGGLFMTLGDFETVARERIPLVVVCLNDHAYGSECVHLDEVGLPDTEALFDAPRISDVAAALGFQSAHISALAQLESAWNGWDRSRGPLLLDCEISREVRSPIYAHI
jgi:thiamine pyrophosphate-dependent acetolactate synthase large subunit-like protein